MLAANNALPVECSSAITGKSTELFAVVVFIANSDFSVHQKVPVFTRPLPYLVLLIDSEKRVFSKGMPDEALVLFILFDGTPKYPHISPCFPSSFSLLICYGCIINEIRLEKELR